MFMKILVLSSVILLLVCEVQGERISVSWDGGGDGHSWSDPYNWEPNIVPDNNGTNSVDVTIDSDSIGPNELQVRLQQSRTVDELNCYGQVDLDVWTYYHVDLILEDSNGLTNNGRLDLNGDDRLEIVGNVTNRSGAELDDLQDVGIRGNLLNNAGGLVDVEGAVNINEGSIQNDGSFLITPGEEIWAELGFQNSGVIEMYNGECASGGPFENQDGGVIRGYGAIHSAKVVRNFGVVMSASGSLVVHSASESGQDPNTNLGMENTGTLTNSAGTSLSLAVWGQDVNNNGTIEVNAGGGVVFDCNLVNEPNGAICLRGGTLAATNIRQSAGADCNGFGTIKGDFVVAPNSPSEPNSIVRLTGPSSIVGDLMIGSGALLEISDGTTLVTGHTTNDGTIDMKGGRLIPQGGITNNGNINWQPGLYNNIADFNLDGIVNLKDFGDFADTWLWQARL